MRRVKGEPGQTVLVPAITFPFIYYSCAENYGTKSWGGGGGRGGKQQTRPTSARIDSSLKGKQRVFFFLQVDFSLLPEMVNKLLPIKTYPASGFRA